MNKDVKYGLKYHASQIAEKGHYDCADALVVAEQLIACLEGEIVKRDARIAELEADLYRASASVSTLKSQWRELAAELAALKEQEPVAHIPVDRETGEEWHPVLKKGSGNICDYKPLYAAPVSEAKAHGVVMPERKTKADYGVYIDEFADEAAAIYNAALDAVTRLNAAPVQQVSVPDGWKLVPVELTREMAKAVGDLAERKWCYCLTAANVCEIFSTVLAAAPAAPAADAMVEALEHARLFIVNGIDLGFIQMPEAGTPDPAHETLPMIDAALAAHRAQGVV